MPRLQCPQCRRPQRTSLCDLCLSIDNRIELVVWQHPSERDHPKGSVSLLKESLNNCHLLIGETYTIEDIQQFSSDSKITYLLFPDSTSPSLKSSPALTVNAYSKVRLLVLDGTWRKARKLFYSNPWLAQLPRIDIANHQQSRYRIRKAEKSGQLSTLEACVQALSMLENDESKYRPLTDAFDQYVQRIEAFSPSPQRNAPYTKA